MWETIPITELLIESGKIVNGSVSVSSMYRKNKNLSIKCGKTSIKSKGK